MVYLFELKFGSGIYYEGNEFTNTKEKAKSRLEKMSGCFLKDGRKGVGRLISNDSGELKTIEKYNILSRDGKIILESLN